MANKIDDIKMWTTVVGLLWWFLKFVAGAEAVMLRMLEKHYTINSN